MSIAPEIMANQVGIVVIVGKNFSARLQRKTIERNSNPVYGWEDDNKKDTIAAAANLFFKIKTTEPKNKQ